MANTCWYTMRIVGDEKNAEKLLRILKGKECEKSMGRVESAQVFNREMRVGERYAIDIYGYCAWSVAVSMMPEEHSDYAKDPKHLTNLVEQSKLLGLDIEVISKEPEMQFSEWVTIRAGLVERNRRCRYRVFEDEASFEAEKAEDEELEAYAWDDAEDDCLEIGGYDECLSI